MGLIVFAGAAAEAIIVVGAIVPGTAVVVAASGIAGAANLPLWPLVLWAAVGAAAGDGLSYWIGHHYGPSLGRRWPLSSRPEVLETGRSFFERYGGKSVFLGRFVPGVKAIIPAIAGMVGMSIPRFLAANLSSGIIWAAAHVLAAAMLGVLLANVGSISGRLLGAVAAALIALLVAFWLARLIVVKAAPRAIALYQAGIDRLSQSESGVVRRLARAGDPRNPKFFGAAFLSGLLVLAAVGFAGVVEDVVSGEPLTLADVSISQLVQSIRTPSLDRAMILMTEFGDGVVVSVTVAMLLVALIIARHWRSALVIGVTFAFAGVITPLIKLILHRQRPIEIYSGAEFFAFPSGHTVFITLLFATLAILTASRLAPRSQIIVWMAAALGVIAIGFSRIYLGAHWPSDVLGGILFGSLISCLLALLLYYKAEIRRAEFWGGLVAFGVFVGFGSVHAHMNMARDVGRYAPVTAPTVISNADWLASAWARLPRKRIDLFGETEEPLSLQYAGRGQRLAASLNGQGWKVVEAGGLIDFLKLLSPATGLDSLPPWPLLQNGKWPLLIMTQSSPDGDQRLVLRLWPSSYAVGFTAGTEPLLVGSVTEETVKHPYGALTAMIDRQAPAGAMGEIAGQIGKDPGLAIQSRDRGGGTTIYLATATPGGGQQSRPGR